MSAKSKKTSSWRIRIYAATTLLGGFLALLFLGEGAMRLLRPDLTPSHQLQTIPDPFIGWRFLPCQQITTRTEHGEPCHVRINAIGFADEDHPVTADPGVHRIVFLGDSFTAATHVDFEESFVRTALRALQKNSEKKFETLNFSQSGFGTINEYLSWQHYASPFHPQDVVLCFFLGNDVANNLLNYPTESWRSPKFELLQSPLPAIRIPKAIPFRMGPSDHANKMAEKNWVYRTFLQPSILYQQYKLLERDIRAWARGHSARPLKTGEEKTPFWKRSRSPTDWQTYLKNPDPEFSEAWLLTEALIIRMNNEMKASGTRLHVALLPGVESLDPAEFQKALKRYPGIEEYSFDLDWPRQRMLRFLHQQNIPSMDLTPTFREEMKRDIPLSQLYYTFDRHFTRHGHRLAGETIAWHLLQPAPSSASHRR